jgi:hypothetical protein
MHRGFYYLALSVFLLAMVSLYIYLVLVLSLMICQNLTDNIHIKLYARRQLRKLMGRCLYDLIYNPTHIEDNIDNADNPDNPDNIDHFSCNEYILLCCLLFRNNRVDIDSNSGHSRNTVIEVSRDSYVSMEEGTDYSDESKEEDIRQPNVV